MLYWVRLMEKKSDKLDYRLYVQNPIQCLVIFLNEV